MRILCGLRDRFCACEWIAVQVHEVFVEFVLEYFAFCSGAISTVKAPKTKDYDKGTKNRHKKDEFHFGNP